MWQQLSICKECILIHLHHPFIFTHAYRFKRYASCCSQVQIQCTLARTLYGFCFFDNQMRTYCVLGADEDFITGVLCLQIELNVTHNRHLTTSLTVFNTTTTFLTLVSHLNRVQLYDIVWICVLLLCCQWAWFPFLSTHMRRGPLRRVVWRWQPQSFGKQRFNIKDKTGKKEEKWIYWKKKKLTLGRNKLTCTSHQPLGYLMLLYPPMLRSYRINKW